MFLEIFFDLLIIHPVNTSGSPQFLKLVVNLKIACFVVVEEHFLFIVRAGDKQDFFSELLLIGFKTVVNLQIAQNLTLRINKIN